MRGCIRTSGVTAAAQGQDDQALSDLLESTAAFDRSLPGSKPLADTYLLRARQLVKDGNRRRRVADLPERRAVAVGAEGRHHAGADGGLSRRLCRGGGPAGRTSARRCWRRCSPPRSSRRAASPASRSPRRRHGCRRTRAIRRLPRRSAIAQDASAKLADLYRKRDELAEAQRQGAAIAPNTVSGAELDKQISDAQAALADADAALAGGVAQLRPARAAGGAGQGRVRRAASGRGVRRHHAQR